MSPKKPNVGKLVQLSEGFIIKQYQSIIWVPKLAYPIENFLGSNTSHSETYFLPETPDNPSSSSSSPIYPRNPSVCLSGLRQPLSAQHWPCITLNGSASTLGGLSSAFWPYASAKNGLSETLCSSRLPLRGLVWTLATPASLSPAITLLSRHYLCLSVFLYSIPLNWNSDHWFYLS